MLPDEFFILCTGCRFLFIASKQWRSLRSSAYRVHRLFFVLNKFCFVFDLTHQHKAALDPHCLFVKSLNVNIKTIFLSRIQEMIFVILPDSKPNLLFVHALEFHTGLEVPDFIQFEFAN